jgi:hypothetical protein
LLLTFLKATNDINSKNEVSKEALSNITTPEKDKGKKGKGITANLPPLSELKRTTNPPLASMKS